MRRVAFLIAASPNDAFYSQIAAAAYRIRVLSWMRWQPSLHVFVGGDRARDSYARWRPYLGGIDIRWASDEGYAVDGDWAQSDDVFRFAPPDADVLVALDADTYSIETLEPIIDRAYVAGVIAGTIAHYPTILSSVDGRDSVPATLRSTWRRLADGLIDTPLDFAFTHTLVGPDRPAADRYTPFYLNFGMVVFPRPDFDKVAPLYLDLRPRVMARMANGDFSGQAALALAVAAARSRTWALPLRYNFPNDPVAEAMYPNELERVVLIHYLRTTAIDRHRIFATADDYRAFVSRPLHGANEVLRESVIATFGRDYPFVDRVLRHTYSP